MRKCLAIPAAAALILAVLSLPGCGSPSTVKIGVIAELTGSIPAVGDSCRNGARLAANDINEAGGITVGGKSFKVELVVRDCGNSAEEAAKVAGELIDDGALAIVGPDATGTAVPAADAAEKAGVVLVTPWSTSPRTTLDASGKPKKYVWRACVTASYEGRQVAGFARGTLGSKAAAVLYDQTADVLKIQAQDFKKSFEKAGGSVVAYEGFKPGATDLGPQMSKIAAGGADVMFVPAYYNDVPVILKQARANGVTAKVIGSNAWSSPDIIDASGFAIEGSHIFNMYSPGSAAANTQAFVAEYMTRYKSTPDDVAALAYDSVGLIEKGLEGAGKLDRQALDDSMLRLAVFNGVSGDMVFTSNSRDPVRRAVMLKVQNGQFALFAVLPAGAPK